MARPHVCDPALLETDLTGKTILVTGANSGIGLDTATQLAKQGAHVVLACRRPASGAEAVEGILAAHPGASVEAMELDLGSLASVRAFAEAFLGKHDQLHVLINNAGIMNAPEGRTEDGFESQIGVCHFGHFLLTDLLLPTLKASAPSRIVNVSSCYHDVAMGREGHIDREDLHFEHRPYDGWEAYAQAKLANLLHAKGLAKHLEGTGVTAVSVHPGWVRTNLIRHSVPVWVQNTIGRPIFRLMGMIEPWEGAQTSLFCALDPSVEENSGAYYSQLGIYRDKEANKGGWPMRSPNPEAHDEELVDWLWQHSLEAVGRGESAAA